MIPNSIAKLIILAMNQQYSYLFVLVFFILIFSPAFSSSLPHSMSKGSCLSVENSKDVLVSPNKLFTAGFHPVGDNAYSFAIWFTKPSYLHSNHHQNWTFVWMANRDQPVNGRRSKLCLHKDGNLVLTDAGQSIFWSTNTFSASSIQVLLHNNGNLVLQNSTDFVLWQSFNSPTDTLVPQQPLTLYTQLVSSRSQSNYSSGFYKLFFDDDNVLRLAFDGPETSSIYWPDPMLLSNEAGRSRYNDTRTAVLDSSGYFSSSDWAHFRAADFGERRRQRRLTLDFDGNLRLYSLEEATETWVVSVQAISTPCKIHGACGPNTLCSYNPASGKICSCLPRFKPKNNMDWSYGCEPEFDQPSFREFEVMFLKLPQAHFYGYNIDIFPNYTFERCKQNCLQSRSCKGFEYKLENDAYSCYPISVFRNGVYSREFLVSLFLKLPKDLKSSLEEPSVQALKLNCLREAPYMKLNRKYKISKENTSLKYLLWVVFVIGCLEIASLFVVCFFLYRVTNLDESTQPYLPAATWFRKYTYTELKRATRGFREEIGRGRSGVVYKGILSDNRVAAIKRLDDANNGEAEFLAEVTVIGRINHINLIEMWGYCAEGKHRILVYEFMDHGSLADNLYSNALGWEKRFTIAVGTAKCLAYLHEECLEWVLHCDVKPQNILLDTDFQPKVADFGLSKLLNRGAGDNPKFSKIRGTRGYMAPEWIFNLGITSKVDVYSYGMVLLEMVTGKSPAAGIHTYGSGAETEEKMLVQWVREKVNGDDARASWIEEVVDPLLSVDYDMVKMETLVRVALNCVEEDKDARPTMKQVVHMLVRPEFDN